MAEATEMITGKMTDMEKRLIEEKEMLEKYFWPEKFPILLINEDERGFEREVTLKSGNIYKLRVYASDKYPDVLPDLVVCESPEPMPEDEEWCGSHETHTWPRKDNFLRICHWHEICWTRKNMLYEVFKKGKEWLQAYEKHVATGEPMALQQMILTDEEKKEYRQKRQDRALEAISHDPRILIHMHRQSYMIMGGDALEKIPSNDEQKRIAQLTVHINAMQRMCHDPDWLADMFELFCTVTERQRNNPDSVAIEVRRNEEEGTMQISVTESPKKSIQNGGQK